ncbi:MAG: serine/threonine protein kinase, partial [Kiritimatiellia bacterium]
MGRVHLAWDPRLRREVALKQPLDGASHEVQQRLVREARVAASLQHPGIVRVYDSGESAQGTPWYTMELIRGKSLREHIDEAEDTKARLNLLPALLAVCEAVAYAHNSGIIHRDLKPDNLMIGAFGQVQVVDWGLARPVDEGWTQILSNVNHTTDGAAMGTPAYMSPEQIEGDNVGPASDVWSIGLLLYELISGQRAYSAPTAREVLVQVLAGPPKPLKLVTPNADPGLVALVERCLQSDPNDRWQHGGELASALGQWLSRRHVAAHTTPKTSWLSLAVVLIVGLVMTGALYRTYDLGVALTQA